MNGSSDAWESDDVIDLRNIPARTSPREARRSDDFVREARELANRPLRHARLVRLFLSCICLAELVVLVPNLLTEIAIQRGLYAPILRTVLAVVRLSPLAWPILAHMGRLGESIRNFMEVSLPSIYGPACGGVEPCRGLATALSGWYLISTPMHDAFSPSIDEAEEEPPTQGAPLDEHLLLPCAVIMSINVGQFLCDALSLTVTPLLRYPETGPPQPLPVPLPRPEVFVAAGPDEINAAKFEPTCVICIADFTTGDLLARLPCGHTFHMECVGQWLRQHGKCPLRCAGIVLPPEESSELQESEYREYRAESAFIQQDILSPWLVGAPMNVSSRSLFTDQQTDLTLPSSLAVEAVDDEDTSMTRPG